ncbi:MAG: glycosyltransferase family 2 protein [Candidatus Omnitrophica bacterium]|nr:glycosyltransferase family 2 protein [Candidatus Omnitrophota bacterium]
MNICILIPILNEAKAIGGIVKELREKKFSVVVIDDGSKDNSGELATQNGAVVLTNEINRGKGFSLQKGFQYVLDHGYDGVITMDGDGQHAIDDLEHFIQSPNLKTNTIINGNRLANSQKMPFVRLQTNRLMSFLISSVCRQKIPDTQCGYRFIGKDVLKTIKLTSDCYEIESEILIKSAKKGFSIHSVPVETIYRGETSYIRPVRDTLRFFKYLLKEIFSS